MKKGALFVSLISCLMIVGLASSPPGFAQQDGGKGVEFKWPRMFRVATPGTASGSFASTNGWAPVIESATGMRVRVIPEDSETGRYVRFTQGKEFELISQSIADQRFAMSGLDGYATTPPNATRLVWHHNDTPWAFVVRADSPYKTIYDLKQKGVKVSLATMSPALMTTTLSALPAYLGWSPEEAQANWTYVPAGSYVESCRAVTDGKADVAHVATISAVLYEMEGHPRGIRFLTQPLSDKEAWARYLKYRPDHVPRTIDFGVPSAKGVDGVTSNFNYWARADMDDELAYQLAKWFHENFESYKGVHALAPRMSIEHFRAFLDGCPLPVHNGTIRYLREIGQWTDKDDQWNNEAIQLVDKYLAARKAALEEAKAKKIKVHWESQEYLEILNKHREGLPEIKIRM